MTTRALPDTVRLIRNYLVTVPAVTTYVASRVWDEAPVNPQFPAIMLRHAGGIPEWYGDDRCRIDVHVYGRTSDEARALVRAAFKSLMEAPQVHAEGILTDVKPNSDLREERDPSYIGHSAPVRFIFTILASTHS